MGLDVARMHATACLFLLIIIAFTSLLLIPMSFEIWLLDPYLMWESLLGGGLFFIVVLILVASIGYVYFFKRLTPTYRDGMKSIERFMLFFIIGFFGIIILPLLIAMGAEALAERNDPGSGFVVFLVVWTVTFLVLVLLFRWEGLRMLRG